MLYMIVNTHNPESCAFRSKPDAIATSGAFDRLEELIGAADGPERRACPGGGEELERARPVAMRMGVARCLDGRVDGIHGQEPYDGDDCRRYGD